MQPNSKTRTGWLAGIVAVGLAAVHSASAFNATGGTITTNNGYRIHTFATGGTTNLAVTEGGVVEVLVVAGGGGGGGGTGGGGGAGGYLYTNGFPVADGSNYTVTVGGGGVGGSGTTQRGANGTNSVFGSLIAFGGGGGGYNSASGLGGGSGGGGGGGAVGGTATNGQGYAGGSNGSWSGYFPMAGGGGASFNGGNAVSITTPGVGGEGRSNSISGVWAWYAGGGGGGVHNTTNGAAGGLGGGGHGGQAGGAGTTSGLPNTGGGGGGGGGNQAGPAGTGGSGIVIVRFSLVPVIDNVAATNVTSTSANLNGFLSFTGSAPIVAVSVYWGTNDGGTVAANWSNSAAFTPVPQVAGPLATNITGLVGGATYYYRFYATNSYGGAWAASSASFFTGDITVRATMPNAFESGPVNGVFTLSRPAASTNAALTVFYSLVGSAINGTDYANLTSQATFPVGATNTTVNVIPIADGLAESSETVDLTLTGGEGALGTPSNATVNITDHTGPEIPQSTMGSSVSSHPPALYAIDGDFATWWDASGAPHWLRLDLKARYAVTEINYWGRQNHPNGRISNYELYVTDSPSTNKADWGAYVAAGTFANITNQQTVLFPRAIGRYVILYALTTPSGWAGAAEVRLYGNEWFTVRDPASGRTVATTNKTQAAIVANLTVDNPDGALWYAITETADPPDAGDWLAAMPTTYTFSQPLSDGLQENDGVTLWGWVRDSGATPKTNSASAGIVYRTYPPIPRGLMVADASNYIGGYEPAKAIDGNAATLWGSDIGQPASWLRLKLDKRYKVSRLDYQASPSDINRRIKEYRIYVTDSTSTNITDWGPPVAVGTLDARTQLDNVTTTQSVYFATHAVGQYVILKSDISWGGSWTGAGEVWVYGADNADPSPVVQSLTLNNPVRNTALFTTGDADATITAVPGEGAEAGAVTHYGVTETDTPPESGWAGWSATLPIRYTLTGSLRTATLYGWAKDANGNVSAASPSTSRDIHFNPDTPTVTTAVTNAPYGSVRMLVTWGASPAAFGRVAWRPVGSATWSYTAWDVTTTTQFSHLVNGLSVRGKYQVMAQLNDVDLSVVVYEHLPSLRELPRVAAYATADNFGAAANAIDNGIDGIGTQWSGTGNAFLRLDMGVARTVSVLAYLGRRDHVNGRIKDYKVYVNDTPLTTIADLTNNVTKVAEGQFVNTDSYGNVPVQHVEIPNVLGRYVYLLSTTTYSGYAGAGEVWLFERVPAGSVFKMR